MILDQISNDPIASDSVSPTEHHYLLLKSPLKCIYSTLFLFCEWKDKRWKAKKTLEEVTKYKNKTEKLINNAICLYNIHCCKVYFCKTQSLLIKRKYTFIAISIL